MADFPSVAFSTIELTSNTPTLISKSLSGLEQRAQVAGQFFSFVANFQSITEDERRQIMGFLMSKQGPYNSFTIALPEPIKDSTGVYSGTITATSGTAGSASFTASVSGANNSLILKSGDLIKFSNHNKVYMCTSNAISNGSGVLTINLFPSLRSNVSGLVVTHKNLEISVRLGSDTFGFSMAQEFFSSFDLDFVEVL
jgi:hypothetical protein